MKIKVVAPLERKYSVWNGVSILSAFVSSPTDVDLQARGWCVRSYQRTAFMGLYAEVLHFKKKNDSDQARRCCEIYQSIEQHKDRVFPMTCSMEFTKTCQL